MTARRFIALALAGGAGLMLALAAPLSASAHVTVTPNGAEPGSYALVTFKVPNESATATTNRIQIDLPTATPFTSVSYVPVAGWDAQLITTSLPKPVKMEGNTLTQAVTRVTWVAQPGHEIAAGQLQLFALSLGAVPDTGKIMLPTTQFYSDSTVVKWNEAGADADHPGPTLYINDEPQSGHHSGSHAIATTTADSNADANANTTMDHIDVLARIIGFAGLAAGAVGITLAVLATRRNNHKEGTR